MAQVSRQSDPTVHAEDCEPQLGEGGYQEATEERQGVPRARSLIAEPPEWGAIFTGSRLLS